MEKAFGWSVEFVEPTQARCMGGPKAMGPGVEQRGRSGQEERSIEAKRLSGVADAVVERTFSWIDQKPEG
jgi:hypothetical protein